MVLFSKKQNTEVKVRAVQPQAVARAQDLAWVLVNPRITEKATDMLTARAYVFNVNPKAGKQLIARAIRAVYKVVPTKIRIVNIRAKSIRNARTGIAGLKPGGKKAYVYLKEGDTITVV